MDYGAILRNQRMQLYAEQTEARAKWRAALREQRARRNRLNEISAELGRIARIEHELDKARDEEGEVDIEVGARISSVLLEVLGRHPDGMPLAQIAEFFGDQVKKSTISATLYNLKKRGDVLHSEATGRYRAAPRTMHSPPLSVRQVPR